MNSGLSRLPLCPSVYRQIPPLSEVCYYRFFSFVFCWLRRFSWVEGLDTRFYGEIRGKNLREWEGIAAAETQVSESRPGAPDFVTLFRSDLGHPQGGISICHSRLGKNFGSKISTYSQSSESVGSIALTRENAALQIASSLVGSSSSFVSTPKIPAKFGSPDCNM